MSNSFTSSNAHVIDNRNVVNPAAAAAGAGRGVKKGGLFQFRRRTMLDDQVSNQTFYAINVKNRDLIST